MWCQEALAFEEYKGRLASVHGISAATVVKISAEFPSAAALCQAGSSKVAFRIQQSLSDFESTELSKKRFSLVGLSTIYKIDQKLMKYDEVGAWSSAMYLELEHFSGFRERFFLYALRMSRQNTLYPRRFVPTEISFSRGGQVVSQTLHLWRYSGFRGQIHWRKSNKIQIHERRAIFKCLALVDLPCRLWSEKTVQIQFLAQCRWQRSHFQQRWIWSLSLWMAALSTWQGLWKTSQRQGFGNWQHQPSGLGPLHLKLT